MARKLISKASNPSGYSWKATRHTVQSTALIELKADSAIWIDVFKGQFSVGVVKGAIVKVTPPVAAAESHVLELEAALKVAGAISVRIMPAQPADKLIADASEKKTTHDARSLRQVALDRAKRVNSRDPVALAALVNLAMDHAEA